MDALTYILIFAIISFIISGIILYWVASEWEYSKLSVKIVAPLYFLGSLINMWVVAILLAQK